MEQSGVVGFRLRESRARNRFPRRAVLLVAGPAEMIGLDQITEGIVRGWVETNTVPTVKIDRRRVSTSTASVATVDSLQLS